MSDETQLPEEPNEEAATAADASAEATPPASDASDTDGGEPTDAEAPAGGLDEEQKIKDELGIGADANDPVSAEEIDQLLGDAVDGFDTSLGASSLAGPAPGTSLSDTGPSTTSNDPAIVDQNLQLLRDVNMKVKVELGRGKMYLKDILKLGQGSVVELERLAGDPLDIYVNEKVIARGEVLVLNENFCIRITEIYDHALT